MLPVPARRRGHEHLDDPTTPPAVLRRSVADIVRSNRWFGGLRAALHEAAPAWATCRAGAMVLDVGAGAGDVAAALTRAAGGGAWAIALDPLPACAAQARPAVRWSICADGRALPFADRSVDVVVVSQVLHHLTDDDAIALLRECARVARVRVVVSDLRRAWGAAVGIWAASWLLGFHPVSRHDGVTSVLRGYTPAELGALVSRAAGRPVRATPRAGYRVTAGWHPGGTIAEPAT
jgi:SAM-dependent methyltransferase